MPTMFCPQCGLEIDLDSGSVRFCRYCGFSLTDTKDALHGYSHQKRVGFSVVTCSYALLLILTLLLHGKYIPLDTGWGYWLSALVIVVSVSFFVSAALSALKPELFSQPKPRGKGILEAQKYRPDVLRSAEQHEKLPSPGLSDLNSQKPGMAEINRRGSVTENTTRELGK